MIYRYRVGHSIPDVDAQVVGEALEEIAQDGGGRIVPAVVVDRSRPPDAPLHPAFTWDDGAAAEKWREDEARRIIRSCVVVTRDREGREQEEIAHVSIAEPYVADTAAYMPTRRAMEDPDLRARIVAQARAQLDGWIARHAHLAELAELVAGIRAAREAEQRRPPPQQRRRRRPPRPPGPQPGAI